MPATHPRNNLTGRLLYDLGGMGEREVAKLKRPAEETASPPSPSRIVMRRAITIIAVRMRRAPSPSPSSARQTAPMQYTRLHVAASAIANPVALARSPLVAGDDPAPSPVVRLGHPHRMATLRPQPLAAIVGVSTTISSPEGPPADCRHNWHR